MIFGHNFWLGGPIDARSMRLNYILQDLLRDIQTSTIFGASKYAPQIPYLAYLAIICKSSIFVAKIYTYR